MDLREAIAGQHLAGLEMLEGAVRACPDELWDDPSFEIRYWRIAYHALFYTDFYLSESEEAFRPWDRARPEAQFLGPLPWPPHRAPIEVEPYSPREILEYAQIIRGSIAQRVRAFPLDGPSGFPWLPLNRLELHFYTFRHTQHHVGQLVERLRSRTGAGVAWIGRGSAL